MADDSIGTQALQHELRLVRERQRGNILRLVVSYRCPRNDCAVGLVRIAVAEEPGVKKFQAPNRCCRCGEKMVYIGLEVR